MKEKKKAYLREISYPNHPFVHSPRGSLSIVHLTKKEIVDEREQMNVGGAVMRYFELKEVHKEKNG